MGKVVAVTGVNSHFASTLLPRLEADPEVDSIIGFDVTPWRGAFGKVEFLEKDVRDPDVIEKLEGVDTLYHLAFVVGEIQDKNKTYSINIEGSKNVFRACAKNRVRKVIYTSSNTVYGAHRENPLHLTEDSPLHENEESYYNKSKIEVEAFVREFFQAHPEIILTVLRPALLFGPRIDNMFSRLYEGEITAMPLGTNPHIHFIHEEDLGEALHLALIHDLPGVYNVGADDAVSAYWTFRMAGTRVIPMRFFLLKPIADLAFKLRLLPASSGWLVMGSHTIFSNSGKFKEATGWRPRYTSEETFLSFLEARGRKTEDRPRRKGANAER